VHCNGEQNVIYFCITEPTPLFRERKNVIKGSNFRIIDGGHSRIQNPSFTLLFADCSLQIVSTFYRDPRPPRALSRFTTYEVGTTGPTKELNPSVDLGITFQGPFPTCLPPILQIRAFCVFLFSKFQTVGRERLPITSSSQQPYKISSNFSLAPLLVCNLFNLSAE
jgi:hypothetical protein